LGTAYIALSPIPVTCLIQSLLCGPDRTRKTERRLETARCTRLYRSIASAELKPHVLIANINCRSTAHFVRPLILHTRFAFRFRSPSTAWISGTSVRTSSRISPARVNCCPFLQLRRGCDHGRRRQMRHRHERGQSSAMSPHGIAISRRLCACPHSRLFVAGPCAASAGHNPSLGLTGGIVGRSARVQTYPPVERGGNDGSSVRCSNLCSSGRPLKPTRAISLRCSCGHCRMRFGRPHCFDSWPIRIHRTRRSRQTVMVV